MTASRPQFIWYELMTRDGAAAAAFYGKVVGWTATPSPGVNGSYQILNAGSVGVGGILSFQDGVSPCGSEPAWVGYIGTRDLDGDMARVVAAGGQVALGRTEIPGVGHFAMMTDPQGAAFILMTPFSTEPLPEVPPNTPGHIGWRELHALDGTAAFGFYCETFGWTPARVGDMTAMDMGAHGLYRLFGVGGPALGGVMNKMADTPRPTWAFYFNVDRLDAAVARAREAGGTIATEAVPVPGGAWIAHIVDPQGAYFGLVAAER